MYDTANQSKIKSMNVYSLLGMCILLIVSLSLCMSLSVHHNKNITAEAAFILSGEGTDESPYLIGSVNELLELSNKVNHAETPEETLGLVFALNSDIDMSEIGQGVEFNPIGTSAYPFAGKFLGRYNGVTHVISNLVTSGKGLFGYTASTAIIEGLGVANAHIGDDSMVSEVGGIVGNNLGTIRYCFFYGTVEGINSVGGIAGVNGSYSTTTGDIDSCYSSGTIIASGTYVGGVVGKNYRRISGAYSLSKIQSAYWPGLGMTYDGNIGGVVGGRMETQDVYNSTPQYAYFNKDNNYTELKAIGYGTSKDTQPVLDNPTANDYRFSGIYSSEFESKSLTELFGTTYESRWQKFKYRASDYSAWYAPVLKNYVPSSTEFLENIYFKNSVAIRRFGYTHNDYEWGSINNPYLIENTSHFFNLAEAVRNSTRPETYLGKFFLQSADLNFLGLNPVIIGRRHEIQNPFSGTYDGGDYAITNFDLNASAYVSQTYVGLFGYLSSNGTVKNVVLENSCIFVGRSFVGSLIGYSQGGTVSNVVSRAQVSASIDYGGGIVGQAEGGNYRNIISDVSFSSIDSLLVNRHKGIFGTSTGTTLTNVWYLDNPSKSGGVYGTGGQGNVLHLTPSYGNLTTSITESGQITFLATPNSGWESSFRTVSEEIIFSGDSFSPLITETRRNLEYYLRFVKEINVGIQDSFGAPVSVNSVAVPSLTSKYWAGQQFAITLDISNTTEGYYVHESLFFDNEDDPISSPDYLVYYYDNYQKKLSVRAEMIEDLSYMVVVVERISLKAEAFFSPQTYTGDLVYNFNPEEDIEGGYPEGFVALVDYYGVNPINVTNNGKYAVIFSKDGVVRGKLDREYVIIPKQLTVVFSAEDHTVVNTVKEFDGIGGEDPFGDDIFQSTQVNQSKVIGIASVDASSLTRLEITAEISYAAPDVNPNETIKVIVRFALRGSAKNNYVVPGQVQGPYGGITKRVIKVVIESPLTKQYDGLAPPPPGVYYVDYRSQTFPKEMELNKPPQFSYSPSGSILSPNVGVYLLSVTFGDASDGNIFELYFADPDNPEGTLEQLDYIIAPKASPVTYIGFEESKYVSTSTGPLVYTPGRIMSYSAEFSDIQKNKHSLSLEHWEGGSSIAFDPFEAGLYISYVQENELFGLTEETEKNYYLTNPSLSFSILPATQSPISLLAEDEIFFDDIIQLSITGGSGDGDISYSSGFGPMGENPTGTCLIVEETLTPTKAGTIYIRATKAASRNYLESISPVFLISVAKVEVVLSLDSATITYGDTQSLSFRFDGDLEPIPVGFQPPSVTISCDDFSASYDSEERYDAGSYNLEMLEDASSHGYYFSYSVDEVVLDVGKRPISVTADNKSIVYGSSDILLTYTILEDIGGDSLQGMLTRDFGLNCGEYEITIGELAEYNPNYEITFLSGLYTIVPATITVRIEPKTKLFGEADPTPTYTVEGLVNGDNIESIELTGTIIRAVGENAYKQGISSPYADYSYYAASGDGAFCHTSGNYYANVIVVNAPLRISPVSPQFINIVQVRTRYGNTLADSLYGVSQTLEMPSLAEARGRQYLISEGRWEDKIVPGAFSWKNDRIKPTFENSTVFIAEAVFNPTDRNYKVSSFNITVSPIRVPIAISFTGENSYEYTGEAHKDMTYSFSGVLGNDLLGDTISYNGDVIDVGKYRATVAITNGNYIISNTNYTDIEIEKKELVIAHPNIKIPLDKEIDYAFTYEGFVEGENASDLDRLPEIDYENVVGLQEGIYPSGARSDNYSFTYMPLDIVVLAIELKPSADTSLIKVSGIFEEGIECICGPISAGLEYKNNAGKFEAAKTKYAEISGTKINSMYLIKFLDSEGQEVLESGVNTMTLTLTEDQVSRFSDFKFFGVSSSGDMILLETPELSGNEVTFEVENLVSVMFLEPETETFNFMYLYIGAGSVAAIIAIIIAIVAIIKIRNNRRIIKFKED